MNPKEFSSHTKVMFEEIRNKLRLKGIEYAPNLDRLENFRVNAVLQDCTMSRALIGMVDKHIVAIHQAILNDQILPDDVWLEKLSDICSYMVLLWAIRNDTGS